MSTTLDRNRSFVRVKDFNSGVVTLEQDGKKFAESGHLLLLPSNSVKYPCPKCDYGTDQGGLLLAHAAKVHQASEDMVICFKTLVQNIDRDLPHDEGIDWHRVKCVRSQAQLAIDEHEQQARERAPQSKDGLGEPAVKQEGVPCPHCPRAFKTEQGLAGHLKFHRPSPRHG